jgi:hypothetical protein
MTLYQVSSEAQDDLFEIWRTIAVDSVDLANCPLPQLVFQVDHGDSSTSKKDEIPCTGSQ